MKEIELAYDIRLFWLGHPEFMSGNGIEYLSWPTALAVVQSFGTCPDIYEVEQLILKIYENWKINPLLLRSFKKFRQYLAYRFGCFENTLDTLPEWTFEADFSISHDWLPPPRSIDIPSLAARISETELCRVRLKYPEI